MQLLGTGHILGSSHQPPRLATLSITKCHYKEDSCPDVVIGEAVIFVVIVHGKGFIALIILT